MIFNNEAEKEGKADEEVASRERREPWVKVRVSYVERYEDIDRCVRLLNRGIVMRSRTDPWGAERHFQASMPFGSKGVLGDRECKEAADRLRRSDSKVWLLNVSDGNLEWPMRAEGMAVDALNSSLPQLLSSNDMNPKDIEWVACLVERDGRKGVRILFFRPAKDSDLVRPWQRGKLTMESIVLFRKAFALRADGYVKALKAQDPKAEESATDPRRNDGGRDNFDTRDDARMADTEIRTSLGRTYESFGTAIVASLRK